MLKERYRCKTCRLRVISLYWTFDYENDFHGHKVTTKLWISCKCLIFGLHVGIWFLQGTLAVWFCGESRARFWWNHKIEWQAGDTKQLSVDRMIELCVQKWWIQSVTGRFINIWKNKMANTSWKESSSSHCFVCIITEIFCLIRWIREELRFIARILRKAVH